MAEDKLQLLAKLNGVTVDALLEWATYSSVAPGICMNRDCDYMTNVEADQNEGYCEMCETQTVQSAPWLAGVV